MAVIPDEWLDKAIKELAKHDSQTAHDLCFSRRNFSMNKCVKFTQKDMIRNFLVCLSWFMVNGIDLYDDTMEEYYTELYNGDHASKQAAIATLQHLHEIGT